MRKLFLEEKNESSPLWKRLLSGGLVLALMAVLVAVSLKRIGVTLDYAFLSGVSVKLKKGFVMTLALSCFGMVTSLLIGCVSALGQGSRILPVRYFFLGYVKLIRGTPLLAQVYLFFYILGTAWGIEDRFFSGVMILSIFEGAYISEIIRGSLLSIERTQIEVGKAIGLSRAGIVREIVLPQMVARTLPALAGQFASVIKDSSLLSVIAVNELSYSMREISALNFKLFECYFLLALLYLILTIPVNLLSDWLERRFGYEN